MRSLFTEYNAMSEFKIGTRRSAMALAQTQTVIDRLRSVFNFEAQAVSLESRGDKDLVSKLHQHGGKGGAFVDELRGLLLEGKITAIMHSLKDMPGNEQPFGLTIGAYLRRECPYDALILRPNLPLQEFEHDGGSGRKIGTSSVRRAAFLRTIYPNAEVIHFRGASDTRIRKLDEGLKQKLPDGMGEVGPADALVLNYAGLERIGLASRSSRVFTVGEMLPSAGQGIVAVECRETDWKTREILAELDDADTRKCALAEREALWVLNGHCNTPIAVHATIAGETIKLAAILFDPVGRSLSAEASGSNAYPRELGRNIALELYDKGAARFLNLTRP